MSNSLSQQELDRLYQDGHLVLAQANSDEVMQRIVDATKRLQERYPFGFDHSDGFGAKQMTPRARAPQFSDRAPTMIYHNAGFLEPDLLLPLHNPLVYETVERIVGKDFYLSNVWLQVVPPGTGRMGYHKDEHGSVSITMPLGAIGWNSGSTCLVPGSHRNTPPPNFCMADIMQVHKREAQLSGTLGDIIFFTPETWHGRAANGTSESTARLFFNFYSRTSREATRWSPCIPVEKVAEVTETLPPAYRHMTRIDPVAEKPVTTGQFRHWVMQNGSSSSSTGPAALMREYYYWKYCRQAPIGSDARDRILPAYRTTITESESFSLREYVSHLNATRTAKNIARTMVDSLKSGMGLGPKSVVKGGD